MSFGGRLKGTIHFIHSGRFAELHNQVYNRDIGCRDPDGHPVEFTGKLGDNQGDSLGRACRCGDHGEGCGPCSSEVLVGKVKESLIAGLGMSRGHEPLLDSEMIEQDLADRSEAIGGT